ncbi:translation initiation factor IF-2-like [Herpailurus yagouaroundi]|uniref:translation initiation factor IF-2-like n=1 Tax=Herpailurus yagouaroundi TaxID=1608482 RepID=UPI001AD6EE79|nr:translation initiation factor IF-2-like [Puma yagouaroundi]
MPGPLPRCARKLWAWSSERKPWHLAGKKADPSGRPELKCIQTGCRHTGAPGRLAHLPQACGARPPSSAPSALPGSWAPPPPQQPRRSSRGSPSLCPASPAPLLARRQSAAPANVNCLAQRVCGTYRPARSARSRRRADSVRQRGTPGNPEAAPAHPEAAPAPRPRGQAIDGGPVRRRPGPQGQQRRPGLEPHATPSDAEQKPAGFLNNLRKVNCCRSSGYITDTAASPAPTLRSAHSETPAAAAPRDRAALEPARAHPGAGLRQL